MDTPCVTTWIPIAILFLLMTLHTAGADPATLANHVAERTLTSAKTYDDPFNEVEVTAEVTTPDGKMLQVPAFWAGGNAWKFRYASPQVGVHTYRTLCSDAQNTGLHGITGSFRIEPYKGANPLYRRRPVRVAPDKRHFEYADGTPFFWLGDTWWMGLCKRLEWPEGFHKLTTDRVKKGYTVIQIVAGLYPDMPAFDERGANEAGFPWTRDYGRINPEYFDAADRRIQHLVESGLSPCVVGAWGYFMPWMGVEKLDKHWRYLVARWGAYPVFWCVAGEANLPYYLTPGFPFDDREQVKGWTQVARYLRATDPYHRPMSIHPTGLGKLDARHAIDDQSLLDFDMLQTGHGDRSSLAPTVDTVRSSYGSKPVMPVLNSEVCYEGILNACHDDVQRLMFWSCVLSGAMGHTYGANGIWQLNQPGKPYGKSPHGGDYGPTPWTEAMNLPGSGHLGLAKKLLEKYPWWKFEPHSEWAAYVGKDQAMPAAWIWFPEGNAAQDAPAAARYFRKSFDIPAGQPVVRATLRITADDRCTAYLNGKEAGSAAGWNTLHPFDVIRLLKPGRNVLSVRAENAKANVPKNPAGLLSSLEVAYGDGRTETVESGGDWRAADHEQSGWQQHGFDDASWPAAKVVAAYGEGPWGSVADTGPYMAPYAAGVTDGVRIVYVPLPRAVSLSHLTKGYRASWFNSLTGKLSRLGSLTVDGAGLSTAQPPPGVSDWLLVLEPGR